MAEEAPAASASATSMEQILTADALTNTDDAATEAVVAEDPAEDADLTSVTTAANLQYGLKNYSAAAELFSRATELQAEERGEMAPENAELLFAYGRCLYHVAVANSEVLGGKVADGEKKKLKGKKGTAKEAEELEKGGATANGEAMEKSEEEEDDKSKPFFQLVDQEADEGEEDGEEDEDEDEEDDFATAYEILDVARVLYTRQLEALTTPDPTADSTSSDKGKAPLDPIATILSPSDPSIIHVKTRLSDTHDLQAEISLENERFTDAISDQRAALALITELHPPEHNRVAEAHYKLSLALEFASVTEVREEQSSADASAPKAESKAEVDEVLRAEAASEMAAAITSCKLRLSKEQALLSTLLTSSDPSSIDIPASKKAKELEIKEVQDLISEMEQRLADLKSSNLPPNPLAALAGLGGPAGTAGASGAAGLLAGLLEQTPAQQKESLKAATAGANDLSAGGLVRRKKEPEGASAAGTNGDASGASKRKAEEAVEAEGGDGKRAKSEAL